jgi:hypothetical protein
MAGSCGVRYDLSIYQHITLDRDREAKYQQATKEAGA